MTYITRLFVLCIVGIALTTWARADTTIVIVRHGEKPALGLGQLSCKGLNRSLALANVLPARYGIPKAIYAPNPADKKYDKGVPYAYVRPLATIEPLAITIGLPVNIEYGMKDTIQLSRTLISQTEGTQIVAWEHHYADKLARDLMASLGGNAQVVPNWNDDDFDSIYLLNITGRGADRHITFTHEQQGLNNLAETCPQQN